MNSKNYSVYAANRNEQLNDNANSQVNISLKKQLLTEVDAKTRICESIVELLTECKNLETKLRARLLQEIQTQVQQGIGILDLLTECERRELDIKCGEKLLQEVTQQNRSLVATRNELIKLCDEESQKRFLQKLVNNQI